MLLLAKLRILNRYMENRLQEAINRLSKANSTSSSIWVNYWIARKLLREMALVQYKQVTKSYVKRNSNLSLPSREFKVIADDVHRELAMFEEEEATNL
jgi:hypothetical protein